MADVEVLPAQVPEAAQSTAPPLEGEALNAALRQQVEFYFSRQNLASDTYLLSKMNDKKYVEIDVIANFNKLKTLLAMAGPPEDSRAVLLDVIQYCENCEADETGTLVRAKNAVRNERSTLILRDIPSNTPIEEVSAIFDFPGCEKPESISPEAEDNWFVRFENKEACINAMLGLADRTFQGKPVRARVKTELSQRAIEGGIGRGFRPPYDPAAVAGNGYPPFMGYNPAYSFGPGYPGFHGMPPGNFRGQQQPSRSQNPSRGARGSSSPKKTKQGPGGSRTPMQSPAGGRGKGQKGKSPHSPKASEEKKAPEVDPQLEFSNDDQFPGLPTKAEVGGYKKPFQTYSREQMADIVALTVASKFPRPPHMPNAETILREEALTDCQLLEPFPVMFPASPSPILTAETPMQQNMPALDLLSGASSKANRGSKGKPKRDSEKPKYATKGKKVRKPRASESGATGSATPRDDEAKTEGGASAAPVTSPSSTEATESSAKGKWGSGAAKGPNLAQIVASGPPAPPKGSAGTRAPKPAPTPKPPKEEAAESASAGKEAEKDEEKPRQNNSNNEKKKSSPPKQKGNRSRNNRAKDNNGEAARKAREETAAAAAAAAPGPVSYAEMAKKAAAARAEGAAAAAAGNGNNSKPEAVGDAKPPEPKTD